MTPMKRQKNVDTRNFYKFPYLQNYEVSAKRVERELFPKVY